MREPPAALSNATLRASLSARYGLAVADCTLLPLGQDSSAWVYRVETADGVPYFLKVRRCVTNPPSLLVPQQGTLPCAAAYSRQTVFVRGTPSP